MTGPEAARRWAFSPSHPRLGAGQKPLPHHGQPWVSAALAHPAARLARGPPESQQRPGRRGPGATMAATDGEVQGLKSAVTTQGHPYPLTLVRTDAPPGPQDAPRRPHSR